MQCNIIYIQENFNIVVYTLTLNIFCSRYIVLFFNIFFNQISLNICKTLKFLKLSQLTPWFDNNPHLQSGVFSVTILATLEMPRLVGKQENVTMIPTQNLPFSAIYKMGIIFFVKK